MSLAEAVAVDYTRIVNHHIEIQDRISEAADTLRRLPDTDRRFLAAGSKCSWPAYVRDWHAYGADHARSPRMPPTSQAIDRMEQTIGWIAWLANQHPEEAVIVWGSFGGRRKSAQLARIMGIDRSTVKRKRKRGIQILIGRAQQLGVLTTS